MKELTRGVFVETDYEGVNVAAIITSRGVVCVDAPSYPQDARHWAMTIQRTTTLPIDFIVLTDYHGDRILNNRWLEAKIIAHRATAEKLSEYERRYPPALLDNLVVRNLENSRELTNNPIGQAALSFSDEMILDCAGRPIILQHAPGPTPGNLWLYLPNEQILFVGDTIATNQYTPLIEVEAEIWLASLARLKQFPHPLNHIIPGRGQVYSPANDSLQAYIDNIQQYLEEHIQENDRPDILVDKTDN